VLNSFETFNSAPHRRFNPLTGEWVLVSPHRTQRPWQGQQEKTTESVRPSYDEDCYLCPGNRRSGGQQNPDYEDTFVFVNDFSALIPEALDQQLESDPLFQARSVRGICKVICFSPRHDLTLPEMELPSIRKVVDLWAEQVEELGRTYRWVQVFENKGFVMGCSNPHPHGQIWATDSLPNEPAKEDRRQAEYSSAHGTPLLLDYLRREIELGERIAVEEEHWVALVPYWAVWPFETLLLPKRHVAQIHGLDDLERANLALILKRLLTRYDNLFETSFPYSMGWHGAPLGDADVSHWQLHAHFYPPLLRSALVKKFMVGYEMLAESQRDLTAEQAAARMRQISEKHFRQTNG